MMGIMGMQTFIGRVIGTAVAPLTFLGSLLRRNRLFHPNGVVYRAEVKPIAPDGPLGLLAQRLTGTALVRLSGGLWEWPQGKRAPDVLGVTVRFRSLDEVTPQSLPGDQDLLLVTAPSLPGLLTAPFRTNVNDFLDNRYYAILPFSLEGAGKVYLRLVPTHSAPAGADRHERLALAVAASNAVLRLELQVEDGDEPWLPIATIELRERLDIEDGELAFDPGSSAMGLVPRGVLQWVRPAAYAASQAGRRLTRRKG
jgi:hypothetical protein